MVLVGLVGSVWRLETLPLLGAVLVAWLAVIDGNQVRCLGEETAEQTCGDPEA